MRRSRRTRRTPRILAPPAEATDTTMSMIDTKTRKPSSTFQLLRKYACSPKYRPSETTWGRGDGRSQPDFVIGGGAVQPASVRGRGEIRWGWRGWQSGRGLGGFFGSGQVPHCPPEIHACRAAPFPTPRIFGKQNSKPSALGSIRKGILPLYPNPPSSTSVTLQMFPCVHLSGRM